jgi:tartrate dehydrogenase/decarboxylase/D-malate dehydrogenase
MMLEHLGEAAAAAAVEQVLACGGDAVTPDMGGSATTVSLGEAVCAEIRR